VLLVSAVLFAGGCNVEPVHDSGTKPPAEERREEHDNHAGEDFAVSPGNSRDALISDMESRYNDSFTFIENAGGGTMMNDHCAVYLHSERFPDDKIYAVRGVFDGKTENRDNYMAYYLREEAASYLAELAKKVYGECRAFYTPAKDVATPPGITIDSTVEELLRSTKNYCSVILPEGQDLSEKDKKLDEMYEKLKGEGINCYFYITYLDNNRSYNEAVSAEGIDREHIIADCFLGMDEDFNIVERQWG